MTNYQNWKTALAIGDTSYETLKRLKDCGISAIEISRRWWEYGIIDWQETKDNADKAGIEIWSFHLPFANEINVAAIDEKARALAVKIQKHMIDKGAEIGIKVFVIHPSAEPIDDKDRPASMEAAKKSLAELAEYAAKYDAIICVEDLPRTCLGHDAKEIAELISADDRLMVCFDVNHLCLEFGCTHKDFVELVGTRIKTTHMSDYDFIDEKHLFCGNGSINWKELIDLLEAVDYNGPFLYEGGFSQNTKLPDIPYGKFEDARPRHLEIKNYTGK